MLSLFKFFCFTYKVIVWTTLMHILAQAFKTPFFFALRKQFLLPYKAWVCCEDEQRQNSRKLLIKIFHSFTGFWNGMFNVPEQNFLFSFSLSALWSCNTHESKTIKLAVLSTILYHAQSTAKLIRFSSCDYKCHT